MEDKDECKSGLRALLTIVGKYTKKRSKDVGSKSAERFMTEFPYLLNQEMISLLAATGTTMLLIHDPCMRNSLHNRSQR